VQRDWRFITADILLCDAADNFAESVATTMQDAAARDRLESAAAELASNYGWPLIGARFGKILETVKKESVELVPSYAETSENLNTSS